MASLNFLNILLAKGFLKKLSINGAICENNRSVLFDTNKHNFESIQCLKSLREYLTDNTVLKSRFSRAALVAPEKFMVPIIKSEVEAYFDDFEQAYKWLKA